MDGDGQWWTTMHSNNGWQWLTMEMAMEEQTAMTTDGDNDGWWRQWQWMSGWRRQWTAMDSNGNGWQWWRWTATMDGDGDEWQWKDDWQADDWTTVTTMEDEGNNYGGWMRWQQCDEGNDGSWRRRMKWHWLQWWTKSTMRMVDKQITTMDGDWKGKEIFMETNDGSRKKSFLFHFKPKNMCQSVLYTCFLFKPSSSWGEYGWITEKNIEILFS